MALPTDLRIFGWYEDMSFKKFSNFTVLFIIVNHNPDRVVIPVRIKRGVNNVMRMNNAVHKKTKELKKY